MKFIVLFLFMVVMASAHAYGQTDADRLYTPAELRSDFDMLQNVLEHTHPGLYTYTSRRQWNRLFAATRRKLDHPMTLVAYRDILQPLIFATHCDHNAY